MADQHFGGFHPPAGNPFGTLANDIIYTGIAAHGEREDLNREEVLIENARMVGTGYRNTAISRMNHCMSKINLTVRKLREFEAKKIVVERMEMLARTYGNLSRVMCDTPADTIQGQIDYLNYALPLKYECNTIRLFGHEQDWENYEATYNRKRKKEQKMIEEFIEEASRKLKTFDDRRRFLRQNELDITEMKKLLHSHEFHNFNVNAIFAGYITPENGYLGLLPDPIDLETVKIINDRANNIIQNPNTQNENVPDIEDVEIEDFSIKPNEHFIKNNGYNNSSSYTRK